VKSYIEGAVADVVGTGHFLEPLHNALSQVHPARLQPNDGSRRKITVVLNQLMTEPGDGDIELFAVEELDGLHDGGKDKNPNEIIFQDPDGMRTKGHLVHSINSANFSMGQANAGNTKEIL